MFFSLSPTSLKTKAMQKRTIIKHIKAIIAKAGEVTSAEMQLGSSPCILSIGSHTCQLVETFGQHKVTAITYVHDREEAEDYFSYEDLSKNILEEILFNLENYQVEQDKLFESCTD